VVTHEPDVARYAARLLDLRDGQIVHDGSTEGRLDQGAMLAKPQPAARRIRRPDMRRRTRSTP
jgi:ABC-type lipoprotein export system ATPase subunit